MSAIDFQANLLAAAANVRFPPKYVETFSTRPLKFLWKWAVRTAKARRHWELKPQSCRWSKVAAEVDIMIDMKIKLLILNKSNQNSRARLGKRI